MLVVPNTRYAVHVPVIIGTNVLDLIMKNMENRYGTRYQQTINLPDSWNLAFRCMKIQSREAEKAKGRLCIVKSALSHKLVIPSNNTVLVEGKIDKSLIKSDCIGITQPLTDSTLPEGVGVTPMLVNLRSTDSPITVQISNLTPGPIVISPSCVICQVQSCQIESDIPAENKVSDIELNDSVLDQLDLSQSDLSEDQRTLVRNLVSKWEDVFSRNDLDIGITGLVKHKIIIHNDEPFKQRHRKSLRPCTQR